MSTESNSRDATLGFRQGVDNRNAETKVGAGFARKADDVDIDTDGVVSTREGYEKRKALTNAHSVWSHEQLDFGFVADKTSLYRVDPDGSLTALVTDRLGTGVHYAMMAGRVFWSDSVSTGAFAASGSTCYVTPWGTETPLPTFTVSASTGGSLAAGTYGIALTFADARGEEGGADDVYYVDVPENGVIDVDNLPSPLSGDFARVRIYRTGANGVDLLFACEGATGQARVSLGAQELGRPLTTLFSDPFPPATELLALKGRLFGAVGRQLVYSHALYPGLTDTSANTLMFPEPITMLAAPETQRFVLYVGTASAVYMLVGESIDTVSNVAVSQYGCIRGSAVMVPPDALGIDAITAPVPVWVDGLGVPQIGTENGLLPLHKRFVYPLYDNAAATFINDGGRSRLLVSGQGNRASSLVTYDSVVATVRDMGGGA